MLTLGLQTIDPEGNASILLTERREGFLVVALCCAALAGIVGTGFEVIVFAAVTHRKNLLIWASDRTAVNAPRLPEGKKYHTFVSHAWASAQADARLMKASLVHHMRDLRVFLVRYVQVEPKTDAFATSVGGPAADMSLGLALYNLWQDVDDLSDISKLEEYVGDSLTMIVILSGSIDVDGNERSDYFSSANCVRELREAVRRDVGIIFVYEPAAPREGCTLATHIQACNAVCHEPEIRSALEDGFIVPMYKSHDLQRVTLCMLLRRIYGHSPDEIRRIDNFHHRLDAVRRPLRIKRRRKEIAIDQCHVYISQNNHGAAQLCRTLQALVNTERFLRVTDDRLSMARANHFLLLLSGSFIDGIESSDPVTMLLLDELRDAMAMGLHLIIVHDCRALFTYTISASIAMKPSAKRDSDADELPTKKAMREPTVERTFAAQVLSARPREWLRRIGLRLHEPVTHLKDLPAVSMKLLTHRRSMRNPEGSSDALGKPEEDPVPVGRCAKASRSPQTAHTP